MPVESAWQAVAMAGFANRREAGADLAAVLAARQYDDPVVLGLPRGGVPVAAAVAAALRAELDVLVVRKVGAPGQPELGAGAVGEGGATYLNTELMVRLGLTEADLATTLRRERDEVARRVQALRHGRDPVPVSGRTVLVVDDGVATGGTAAAAAKVLRRRGAERIVLAVPVGPPDTLEYLAVVYDEVVCLQQPAGFHAVGQYYGDFGQLSDADVVHALERAGSGGPPA